MDLIDVLKPFFSFLVDYFAVEITLAGYTFSVGALYMWCFLVIVLIMFVKGLAD